jgi:glutathione peroxidase
MDLYSIPVTTIDGEATTLADWRGHVLLVVNTASRCGFTPQYEGLERLYRRHKDAGFAVLAFPCDQFGHQEPGDEAEIRSFCTLRYDVTFPMFAKVEVNGPGTHPLFAALKAARPGVLGSEAVKWNFTKFLVDRGGRVAARHAPTTAPDQLDGEVRALLGAPQVDAGGQQSPA